MGHIVQNTQGQNLSIRIDIDNLADSKNLNVTKTSNIKHSTTMIDMHPKKYPCPKQQH